MDQAIKIAENKDTFMYVVIPQEHNVIEILSNEHEMLTERDNDVLIGTERRVGYFYESNGEAVSGGGADSWWVVSKELNTWLQSQIAKVRRSIK